MAERSPCDSASPANSVGLSEGMDYLSSRNSTRQMCSDDMDDLSTQPAISPKAHQSSDKEMEMCLNMFEHWPRLKQTQFVEKLLSRMFSYQHEQIHSILKPMLQRDFITDLPKRGMFHIAYKILSYLDAKSLCRAEQVCMEWHQVIANGMLWKRLISRKVHTDPVWKVLSEVRGWGQHLTCQASPLQDINHEYFRRLYPSNTRDIQNLEENWRNGHHSLTKIECRSENSKGVYCLQYDDKKIVAGLRDTTIKIWERHGMQCTHVLRGHTGSVLCLQYNEKIIITGSSDSTIRVWDVNSGQLLNTLVHHSEAVLQLRFGPVKLVTCSKDQNLIVWLIKSPTDITLHRVLVGHRAAVNVVDFDDKYIVSGSGDRTIKVWRTSTCQYVRTLYGHRKGIACLQYRGRHIVSGSSDKTIRIWDVECGTCLQLLEGHEELVRCIRFNDERIVSGAYDGTIKVWDLTGALNPWIPRNSLCLKTLSEHTGRVFALQFDNFQIVSSSQDDTILVWDFLDPIGPDPMGMNRSTYPSIRGHLNPNHRLDSAISSETSTANYPVQETQPASASMVDPACDHQ